jgi:hypothetical protein
MLGPLDHWRNHLDRDDLLTSVALFDPDEANPAAGCVRADAPTHAWWTDGRMNLSSSCITGSRTGQILAKPERAPSCCAWMP